MKIAFASSEVFPFAKTGGLGDVLGALPKHIQSLGNEVKVFLPRYSSIELTDKFEFVPEASDIMIRVAGESKKIDVYKSYLPGSDVEVYFIDSPHYYNRGVIYTNDHDEDERFILFVKGVIEVLQHLKWPPDIIHCNDWQTGLLPLLLKDNYSWDSFFDKTATVMTIHNIGYQGRFPRSTVDKAEIRKELFYDNSPIEVWGSVCFLKTGLMYADALNTVSETYAGEITTSEYGEGLEGVLSYRVNDFSGILNGVDYEVWNPELDPLIPFKYNINDIANKEENKRFLLQTMNLPYKPFTPVLGIVSRLVDQKGFDIFAQSLHQLLSLNLQIVVLGSGEYNYEDLFRRTAYSYPDKFGVYIGKSENLAHLIEAGSDIFLMPSKYEPCGLNQIYSLKYGTIPIVRKTGGLADTVKDWHEHSHLGDYTGNGFSFYDYSSYALSTSIFRALDAYNDKELWHKLIKNGMACDFSWQRSAESYIELYKKALRNRNSY